MNLVIENIIENGHLPCLVFYIVTQMPIATVCGSVLMWRGHSCLQRPDSSGRGSRRVSTLQPERLRHRVSSRIFHDIRRPETHLDARSPENTVLA